MVQTKKRKRSKKTNADFKKQKIRLGRKLKPSQNTTDTSFVARQVKIREQRFAPVSEDVSALLPLMNHHNAKARVDALENAQKLLEIGRIPKYKYPALFQRMIQCLVDDNKNVRSSSFELFKTFLLQGNTDGNSRKRLFNERLHWFAPFFNVFALHTCAALNSITFSIRMDSLKLLDLLCEVFPQRITDEFETMMITALSSLTKQTVENSVGKFEVEKASTSRPNRSITMKHKGQTKLTSGAHRVGESFLKLLSTFHSRSKVKEVGSAEENGFRTVLPENNLQGNEDSSSKKKAYNNALASVLQLWISIYAEREVLSRSNQMCEWLERIRDCSRLVCLTLRLYLRNFRRIGNKAKPLYEMNFSDLFLHFPLEVSGSVSKKQQRAKFEVNCYVVEIIFLVKKMGLEIGDDNMRSANTWLLDTLNAEISYSVEELWPALECALYYAHDFSDSKSTLHFQFVQEALSRYKKLLISLVDSDSTNALDAAYAIRHFVPLMKARLDTRDLIENFVLVPRIIWNSFKLANTTEQITKINMKVSTLLSSVLYWINHCNVENVDDLVPIAQNMAPLLYAARKDTEEGPIGPFVESMSNENRVLILRILAALPVKAIPMNLLKACAICAWILPADVPNEIIFGIMDLPFISFNLHLNGALSYAFTLIWGFPNSKIQETLLNYKDRFLEPNTKSRHIEIGQRIGLNLANLAYKVPEIGKKIILSIRTQLISEMTPHDFTSYRILEKFHGSTDDCIEQSRMCAILICMENLAQPLGKEQVLREAGKEIAAIALSLLSDRENVKCQLLKPSDKLVLLQVQDLIQQLNKCERLEGLILKTLEAWISTLEKAESFLRLESLASISSSLKKLCEKRNNLVFTSVSNRLEALTQVDGDN